jgi:hypothetical protein
MVANVDDNMLLRVLGSLSESQRRWVLGREALRRGHGGIKTMCDLTGVSKPTVLRGIRELKSGAPLLGSARARQSGGGRKKTEDVHPEVLKRLEEILDESTAGDPMRLLKWTSKSTYKISDHLSTLGYSISEDTVQRLLKSLDYSLQGNVKTKEGPRHPDRDAQFRYLHEQAKAFVHSGDPVLSIDAKKKEKVGNFKNPGEKWRKSGQPREVNVYDFVELGEGHASLYGAYDPERNAGMVNVGMSHDTAEFAVESIRRWWRQIGRLHYPRAQRLLLCADGGGSNGRRNRLWKYALQTFTDDIGIPVTVCHYAPGASKWNKIEHRMFSFISLNWRGEPLVSYETVIQLINATTTKKGLRIKAVLDKHSYETGIKITDDEMKTLCITGHDTFPHWNYTISPRN